MIKKKTFILLSVGLLLSGCVLGGNNEKAEEGGIMTSRDKQEQTVKGSLKDILSKVKGQQCSWSYEGEDMSNEGVVYVGQGKMYGEFMTEVAIEEGVSQVDMRMINDGKTIYQWVEGKNQGTKMSVEKIEEMEKETEREADAEVQSLQQEYEYKCSNWRVDESKFKVPVGIKFLDLTEMMQQTQEQADQIQQDTCSVCYQLPEGSEARQQCLESCQ